MKTSRLLILKILCLVANPVCAEIIGYDSFAYPDGPFAGANGGVYWDWKNTAPTAHTGNASTWDDIYNAPTIRGGDLETEDSGAKREYGGPNLAAETAGAINWSEANTVVYFKSKFTVGPVGVDWCGLSSFDFATERLFWGLFPDGTGRFSIYDQTTGVRLALSTVTAVPGQTYTMVARLDFANGLVRLYVNPDLSLPEPAAAAATATYGETYWSTAVRLASGGTGRVTWADVLVSTTWADLRSLEVNTSADEFNTPSGVNLSLREALRDAAAIPGPNLVTFATAYEMSLSATLAAVLTSDGAGVIVAGNGVSITGPDLGERLINNGATGKLTIFDTSYKAGSADGLGGAIANAGELTLTRCTFTENYADGGGAIYNAGSLNLTHCTFDGNVAEGGGGILNHGTGTLLNCTFVGNRANEVGGGGALHNSGTLTLTQCTFTQNYTSGEGLGGTIYNSMGTLNLRHCTLADNSAPVISGVIHNTAGSTLNLTNNILASGFSGQGILDIYNSGIVNRIGVNLIQWEQNFGSGTSTGLAGLIRDPQLASLSHYGGPTQTMLPLAGSAVIDAVPAGSAVAGLNFDQRGEKRIADGNRDAIALADLGAVERNVVWVNTRLDLLRLLHIGSLSLREALAEGAGPEIAFDPTVFTAAAQTITLDAAKGEIVIFKQSNVDGSSTSTGVTVDAGAGNNRVFNVQNSAVCSLHSLQLQGGDAEGSAVQSSGRLTLSRCQISQTSGEHLIGAIRIDGALNGGWGRPALAMFDCAIHHNSIGLSVQGPAQITRCTFYDNTNGITPFGIDGCHLRQCTFSRNTTAIAAHGSVSLTHCTLSGNSVGISQVQLATITLNNCIVAGNAAGDLIHQGVHYSGRNIVQSISSVGPGSEVVEGFLPSNADPLLATLADYGGPTLTMALRLGSPARNAASPVHPPVLRDQRGYFIEAEADVGAYEAGNAYLNSAAQLAETLPGNSPAASVLPTADFDGDGQSNQKELVAGTNPGNATSVLRIASMTRVGSNLRISFPSAHSRIYSLWTTTSLATGPWTQVPGTVMFGTGSVTEFIVPVPVEGRRFYRVEAEEYFPE